MLHVVDVLITSLSCLIHMLQLSRHGHVSHEQVQCDGWWHDVPIS